MPASNLSMIHRLQTAINQHGGRLLLDRAQFFSEDQKRPISMYRVCEVVGVANKLGHRKKNCLFETASQIQVVLFLRDYWFILNGKELPPIVNNKIWGEIREAHMAAFDSAREIYERNKEEAKNGGKESE